MTGVLLPADLGPGVAAGFTTRWGPGGEAFNLSHRRPHVPQDLAAARRVLGDAVGVGVGALHHMAQVHGADVGLVTSTTPPGAEARGVDALVSDTAGRALVVQVADCVPVLLAAPGVVAAVHAGRQGVARGVVAAALAAMQGLSEQGGPVRAAIGPAIGGCCYEVPADLRDEVDALAPGAAATTTWGTPSLDLPTAVEEQLRTEGVLAIDRVAGCTRCDPDGRFFSHRADPGAGRQVGVVVRVPA